MTLDSLPTLVVEGQPYQLRPGDHVIFDSRNGTLFVHAAEDDDVYFRVGDHLLSRFVVGPGLSTEQVQEFVGRLSKQSGLAGEVKQVEGSFPTLLTFLLAS